MPEDLEEVIKESRVWCLPGMKNGFAYLSFLPWSDVQYVPTNKVWKGADGGEKHNCSAVWRSKFICAEQGVRECRLLAR